MVARWVFWVVALSAFGTERVVAQGSPAGAGFQRLKALAGEWETVGPDGVLVRVVYEVVSGGTAVLERVLGAEHGESGMMSIFYLSGDRLAMSHFCTAGNQPRFESPGLDGTSLTFALVPTSLADLTTGHIHQVAFRFGEQVESVWDWVERGTTDHQLTRRQRRVTR